MNNYQAWAYIGVFELIFCGEFDSELDAIDALNGELDRQLEGEDESDKEAISEIFWASSIIKEVGNE